MFAGLSGRANFVVPQVRAQIFQAGVADSDGDGLALEIAVQQLVRAGDVRAGGVAGENALRLRQATRDFGDLAVVHREVAVDVVVVDERQLFPVAATLNDVCAARDARAGELGRQAAELVADPAKLRVLEMLVSSVTPYDLRGEGLENDLVQLGAIEALPFENVTAPTLVLHGTEDADVPFADAEHSAASIQDARLAAIDGGWHVLPLSKQSTEAAKERLSFLHGLPS